MILGIKILSKDQKKIRISKFIFQKKELSSIQKN